MTAPLILGTNSIKDEGYVVDNSLRFDDGSSDHLTKTLSTPTNNKKFTLSFWTKLTKNDSNAREIIAGGTDGANETFFRHAGGYGIQFRHDHSTDTGWNLVTSRVFRDPSAWYHFVASIDTTQATASNRIKFYVNGVQETSFSTENYPAQNEGTFLNTNAQITIGKRNYDSGVLFDGYLAEFVMVDGQALDPTSFGEFDSDTGIWKPIDVSGLTFGTNGFYLDFEDSSALGNDVSGNNNDFTVNNLTSVDQSTDTCTNNFATFNSLLKSQSQTYAEGNLQVSTTSSGAAGGYSSIAVSQGKWYAEFKLTAFSTQNRLILGVTSDASEDDRDNRYLGADARNYAYSSEVGQKKNNNSGSSYGDSFGIGDIIGVALDLDNNKLYFSKNGTFQDNGDPTSGATGTGAAFTLTDPSSTTTGYYFFGVSDESGSHQMTCQANFGSPPYSISSGNSDGNGYGNFEYSVPSGYYALCTKNLAEYG